MPVIDLNVGPRIDMGGNRMVVVGGSGPAESGFSAVTSVYVSAKVQLLYQGTGPHLVLLVEQSANGSSWSTAATFTFSYDGTQSATITNPLDFVRVSWQVTNASEWYLGEVVAVPSVVNSGSGGGGGGETLAQTLALGASANGVKITGGAAATAATDLPILSQILFRGISGKTAFVPSTGVAATDTAALQAAHDAFDTSGGTIALDRGPYALTGGSLNFTKPTRLLGSGPGGPNVSDYAVIYPALFGTKITVASGSTAGITVNSDYCSFENLSFLSTAGSTPTASAAIRIASHGAYTQFTRCSFTSFYDNVEFLYGYYCVFDRCHFEDPVRSSVHFVDNGSADWGDNSFNQCSFNSGPNNNSTYGIYWESGGGLRVVNSKFNFALLGLTPVVAIFAYLASGSTTGALMVSGCSIENHTTGVYVHTQAGGGFHRIAITGNEIDSLPGGNPIVLGALSPGQVGQAVVTGNAFGNVQTIRLFNIDDVTLAGNNGSISWASGGVTNLKIDGYSFSTAARPPATIMRVGSWYYDTTLHFPAYSDGTNWKDAAGNTV